MNKPILIDSLYINMGGGKVLLGYLCERLIARGIDFVLLKDVRTGRLKCEENIPRIDILTANIYVRKTYYKAHVNDYSSVFCFGNIPAPIKMPCPVHTYVHNINLLKIPSDFKLKRKIGNWLKRRYIASLACNTQSWIIQTQNTEECLRRSLPMKGKKVYQLPFYQIPETLRTQNKKQDNRNDFVIVGDYTGTRGHDELLGALRFLNKKGITPCFHMTVSFDTPFARTINNAIADGLNIINHGIIPFKDVINIYGKCKATVYPSINESLGLGIIEAIEAGCDVIAPNLPFVHSICKASEVFEHRTPEDIAMAIMRYNLGKSSKSELVIHNCIEELINVISMK